MTFSSLFIAMNDYEKIINTVFILHSSYETLLKREMYTIHIEMGCSWFNTEINKRKTSINNKNTQQIRR